MSKDAISAQLAQHDGELYVRLKDMFDQAWNPVDVARPVVPNLFIGPCVIVYRQADDGHITGSSVSSGDPAYDRFKARSMTAPRIWSRRSRRAA